jgi:UDP-N-acetylglucosamine diphosphorylase/glucosamine-1-phosphate N-acetyltransferase
MAPRLLIFEDAGVDRLKPLTWTRPVWDLRCGIATLAEKIAAAYPGAEILYHAREYLAGTVLEDLGLRILSGAAAAPAALAFRLAGPLLLVNGRMLAHAHAAAQIPVAGPEGIFRSGETVVAARLADGSVLADALRGDVLDLAFLPPLPTHRVNLPVITWPWDLVNQNSRQIAADFARMGRGGQVLGKVHPSATLVGAENIFVGPEAEVWPGAILLAERGPIHIGPRAVVMAGAVIQGPAAICEGSHVRILSKVYEGVTAGPGSKIGGEIERSVLHSYANKQHEGFLGHSYIGRWCNVGADSNSSDLKNNYSTVRVTIEGKEVDSGSLFVGLLMGDHAKSGINTMFNTGTVVGVGCNVYGGDFPPKEIPSFTWGGADGLVEYEFDKFCVTAERVMARRDRKFTTAQREMLAHVFEATGERRAKVLRA